MTNKLVVLALALMLGACGDQGGQTAAPAGGEASAPAATAPAETTAAAPAAPAAPAPAEEAPAEEAPAAADEEVKYDPIDASKLDNSWYKQFGGGN